MSERVQVVMGVVFKDERFLALRRAPEKEFGSCWHFPGGKLEPGEFCLDGLVRELHEEVDLDIEAVDVGTWQQDYDPPLVRLACHFTGFAVVRWRGSPRAVEPNTEVAWLTLDEFLAKELTPMTQEYLTLLLDLPSWSGRTLS